MSRSASQFASGRFVPATYGVLIALALVSVALVVRREMHRRNAAPPSAKLPETVSAPEVPVADDAKTESTAPDELRSSEAPTLPRLSMRQPPASSPLSTNQASPVPTSTGPPLTPDAPRIRVAAEGAGLAFPPTNLEPPTNGQPPAVAGPGVPVAATIDESQPQVVSKFRQWTA
jgi:hypothetical protein